MCGHHGYVDDSVPFRTWNSIIGVIQLIERDSTMLFKWFADNQLKVSDCHLLVNKKVVVVIGLEDPDIKTTLIQNWTLMSN